MSEETSTLDSVRESNEDRRAAKLQAKIQKNHRWRLSTWGKASRVIEACQSELEALGRPMVDVPIPDLTDPEIVSELADLR